MSTLENYLEASFRDIPFLMERESKTGGARTVIHEYPNSKKRYIESIGEIPPTFTMTCIIHGDDAINRRLDFELALNDQSIGVLSHPIYGLIEVKALGPYTVSSSQSGIGAFKFAVTFAVTEEVILPSVTAIDSGQVSANADAVSESLNDTIEETYKNPTFAESLTAAADKIDEVTRSINDTISSVVTPIQENVAAFNSVVSSVQAGALTIMQRASTMKQSMVDLYDGFRDIANFPQDLADAWKSLISFGVFDTAPANTIRDAEIKANDRNLNMHTRLNGLARLFESYAYSDFQTETDIDEARTYLNTKYNELLLSDNSITENSTTDFIGYADISLNQDMRDAFALLRSNTMAVLNSKEQSTLRIKTIKTNKTSIGLVAYRYYGSLDNISILQGLNPGINHSIIKAKELKVVT